jgi:tetratricopeptide (TPR) repeat protein
VLGTLAYMAPEQARGDLDAGAGVDVFALGCVLFECLAGRPAFEGAHGFAVLAKILMEDPPRARELCPEVPPELDDLLASMLAKTAAGRPEDGAAVAVALGDLHAGKAAQAAVAAAKGSPPTLTAGEQRLVSVILTGPEPGADGAGRTLTPTEASVPFEQVRADVSPFGAQIERLRDGSVIAVLSARGVATDQAARAARCALVMRGALPFAPMVLATGRGVLDGKLPVGEVIDTAAALLRAAAPGHAHVLVDEVTAGLLHERFDIVAEGGARELRGVRDAAEEPSRMLLGKPTPCVGRDREIATLEGLLGECVEEPVARAVLVTGPPGIGKSRVRHELLRRVRGGDGAVEVWSARCDALGGSVPFALLAKVLRAAAGLLDGEPLDVRREKLRARVERIVGRDRSDRLTPFLGELMGTPFPAEGNLGLRAARRDPRLLEDEMRSAFIDFLVAACEARPTLLVLEDLHWGDEASLRAIDLGLGAASARPLMVLAFARPEVRDLFPRLWIDRRIQEIGLGELGRRASERLVREALGEALDPAVTGRLVALAAGNAFYLEELIRATAEGHQADLPGTVLAMVQARLGALDPGDRRVLRAASVLGEAFWVGAVEAMVDAAATGDVRARLDRLAGQELVERRAQPRLANEIEYTFRHATIREGAYAMLTDRDRALGHRLASEWLERMGAGDLLLVTQSARHAERAAEEQLRSRDEDGAARAFARAATLHARVRRFDAAVTPMLRALGLVDVGRHEAGELVGWLEVLDASTQSLRSAPGLPAIAERALVAIDAGGTLEQRVRSRIMLAGALGCVNVFDRAYALLEAAISTARDRPDLRRAILAADMEISTRLGDVSRGQRAADELSALGVPDDPRVLIAVACLRAFGGDAASAFDALERAERLSDPDDQLAVALHRKMWLLVHSALGSAEAARTVSAAAIESARALGLRYDLASNLHNLGDASARLGDRPGARAALSESLAIATAFGYQRLAALDRAFLDFLDGLDSAAGAEAQIGAFVARSEEEGNVSDVLAGEELLARLYAHRGQRDEARGAYERVLAVAQQLGFATFVREATEALREL